MPVAEIIAIGTELLLGETQDTNTRYLARVLRENGIDLYRTSIIGDNANRIAQAINESVQRCDIIITTGGLGPTVDDPTREAVAKALGVQTKFREELWQQIEERFSRFGRTATDNNRKQAYIPEGAQAIENQVGTAPAFWAEKDDSIIISLPGVPREMEFLIQHNVLPLIKERFNLTGTIRARVLHTGGVGESQVDEWICDLEINENPTVGLLAHPGQVDIRITAKADSPEEADVMIAEMEQEVRKRLKGHVYGADKETLEESIAGLLEKHQWKMVAFECGLEGFLVKRLVSQGSDGSVFAGTEAQPTSCSPIDFEQKLADLKQRFDAQIALGAHLVPGEHKQELTLRIITPEGVQEKKQSYGGPREHGPQWSMNAALDFARRSLSSTTQPT
jgi:competence/damage-inducible protein CinA-like protein